MFPEFESDGLKVLFFSRGRGRSHAIRDMEIARQIEALSPGVQIRFVSYGTGSDTFEKHEFRDIALPLPDDNSLNETIVLAGRLIGWLDPDLVISHEEFAVLPVAKILDKPTVLVTDWFIGPEMYSTSNLGFADRIVFLDVAGHFDEPPQASGRVQYVGPLVRRFTYSCSDGARAREELGLPADSFVVAVLPGSWREAQTPIATLVLDAFDAIPRKPKHLLWMAAKDSAVIARMTGERKDILVKDYDPMVDRVIVASDVAITKTNRQTHHEICSLGVPSLSISFGVNPIDDARTGGFTNNRALSRDVTAADLCTAVLQASDMQCSIPDEYNVDGVLCARVILDL
jgi:predicted glycosyltransferase